MGGVGASSRPVAFGAAVTSRFSAVTQGRGCVHDRGGALLLDLGTSAHVATTSAPPDRAFRCVQLYIGNLTPGLVTDEALRQVFNSALMAAFPEVGAKSVMLAGSMIRCVR